VPLVVNYIHLWASAYRALRQRVRDAGGSAAIVSIACQGFNQGPFRTWSPLYDYGSHDLALVLDLVGVGAVARVRHARRASGLEGGQGELFTAELDLASVAVDLKVGNGAATKARRLAVTLRDGRQLVYDDLRPDPEKLVDGGRPVAVDQTPPLDRMVGEFLALSAGVAPPVGGTFLELAVKVQEILDGIRALAATTV